MVSENVVVGREVKTMRLDEKTPKGHLDRQNGVVLREDLPNPSHPVFPNHILRQMKADMKGAWTNWSRRVWTGHIGRHNLDGR